MELFERFEENRKLLAGLFWIITGNLIFAACINILITPMSLYNGGFLGIAQLLRYFLVNRLGITIPGGIDLTGIIYFLMNVPLFWYAYKVVGKEFAGKTLLSVGISSLMLALIPVPEKPYFNDYLTAVVVAGVICGLGAGMVLRGGGSTGGSDIIGMCMAKVNPNATVGTFNIIVNIVVYTICLLVFSLQIAVYSFIYTTIRSVFMDRMHAQNINVEALIITKVDGIDKIITEDLHRGVTVWEGRGAYTDDNVHVIMTVVSKFETMHLKHLVTDIDPHAFMMLSEGERIVGNFKKHLIN